MGGLKVGGLVVGDACGLVGADVLTGVMVAVVGATVVGVVMGEEEHELQVFLHCEFQ